MMDDHDDNDNSFHVHYTIKDVILYALSVGFGSTSEHYHSDLPYIDEQHDSFTIFPLFCLSLIFWSHQSKTTTTRRMRYQQYDDEEPQATIAAGSNSLQMPNFPPPLMQVMGVIPGQYWIKTNKISNHNTMKNNKEITSSPVQKGTSSTSNREDIQCITGTDSDASAPPKSSFGKLKQDDERLVVKDAKENVNDDNDDDKELLSSSYPMLHTFQRIIWYEEINDDILFSKPNTTTNAGTTMNTSSSISNQNNNCNSSLLLPSNSSTNMDNKSQFTSSNNKNHNTMKSATLKTQFVAIIPKSIGTFVTTETRIYIDTTKKIAIMDSSHHHDDDNNTKYKDQQSQTYNHGQRYEVKRNNESNNNMNTTGKMNPAAIKDEQSSSSNRRLWCSIESTTLILGLPPEQVLTLHRKNMDGPISGNDVNEKTMWTERDITIATNQALLYRLASGDTNRIHIDPKAIPSILVRAGEEDDEEQQRQGEQVSTNDTPAITVDDTIEDGDTAVSNKNDRPPRVVLHGLCTLGIVGRILLQSLVQHKYVNHQYTMRSLECRFVQPVWIGDDLVVRIWRILDRTINQNGQQYNSNNIPPTRSPRTHSITSEDAEVMRFQFEVYNKKTKLTVVDKGYAVLGAKSKGFMPLVVMKSSLLRSKL